MPLSAFEDHFGKDTCLKSLGVYPATPGWGVRRGCVCLGLSFGCAQPLLGGVLGCVCACVPAPLVPCNSWLGCVVWVCVFGLGFRLRPASPGWGVGVCVCSCAPSACTPPLLAGVCGVGVCALAWVSAAPRHFWLGCWGVCVFVCPLCLFPATPGSVVWCVCVCLGSGFGCARPLLAGVLGCVFVRVPTPLVPRHSWLGCAPLVYVLWLGFWLRPATPGWGVGMCSCSCARSACTPPLLAGVCGVGVCAWAWVSAAPRLSWVGCWGVCVLVCPLRLYPATPGLAVCVWARVLAAPRHSWLGNWGVCVFLCAVRLYPATPGWGVRRGCVCLGSVFGCVPPLLAGVLGCVCASVCPLRLYPANSGWGVRSGCVCFGLAFGCAPPLLAGLLGCVCAPVRAPLVPRHCWLGCVVWVCVLGLGFRLPPPLLAGVLGVSVFVCPLRLYPATPGCGVRRGCVFLGLGFGCAPPLLAGVLGCVCVRVPAPLVPRHPRTGVCGVCVCVRARVSAAPCHNWLGCWGVCVFVCPLRSYPATVGGGVRCDCVCSGSSFGCAPPLLAGVLGCVCICVPALLVPRHSWLGCGVWVCVFGLWLRLRPAALGWSVGMCVCVCARSACTPQLLAGVGGVGVCAWFRVSAAPRHSWRGCWGVCVCVCVLGL